ncbi:g10889 [Coccomyxa elongata]
MAHEFRATASCPWPLLSKRDIEESSPSRREGMEYKRELAAMRSVCEVMKKTGAKLKLTRAVATAIVFAHRYYALKSLQQNDRFIIACACLFLAGKVEDEPRALHDIATVCFRQRYNNSPEALKSLKDPQVADTLRESILTAERALLYALGFQFSIDHPQVFIRDTLDRFSAMPEPVGSFWRNFRGNAATISLMQNFINDLYKGTKLVLRFDLRLLGAAAIHLGLATLESKLPTWNHNIVPSIDGKPWYEVAMTRGQPFGSLEGQASPVAVTKELLEEIGKEILALYVTRSNGTESIGSAASEATRSAGEADGPVTPPLEQFQAPTPTGSQGEEQVDMGKVEHPPGHSPLQEGQSLAGALAAAQPGSSAQAGAGLSSTLRPDAAEFVPSADKADPAGPGAAASAQHNGVVRKRTSEAAGLQSCAGPETRSPKAQRSMNGHAGRSPAAEMRPVLVPNGQPECSPGQGTKGAQEAAGLQKALSAQESGEITLS